MPKWLSFRCGNSREFLNITNQKLFHKYQEFLPEIEFYERSSDASQNFLDFFNSSDFVKVILFLEKEFNPYELFAGSIKYFKNLSAKCNMKSARKQLLANNYGNSSASTEELLLVIEKYIESLCLTNSIERKAYCYQSIGFFFLQLRGYQ